MFEKLRKGGYIAGDSVDENSSHVLDQGWMLNPYNRGATLRVQWMNTLFSLCAMPRQIKYRM